MTYREIYDLIGALDAIGMVFDGESHRPIDRLESGWAKFEDGTVVDWLPDTFADRPQGYVPAYRLVIPADAPEPTAPPHPIPVLRGIAARIATGAAIGSGS